MEWLENVVKTGASLAEDAAHRPLQDRRARAAALRSTTGGKPGRTAAHDGAKHAQAPRQARGQGPSGRGVVMTAASAQHQVSRTAHLSPR
ncbi:hypothetical protein [Nonomuraea dietziae]|uniref:hypothetical protein n=1 Tax=Nonomuraea dietziae TaxID=65515 RepID=UPI0031E1A46D